MRSTIGVLLAVLITPLAQAELIDDINDRGELRIAVQPDNAPYSFKDQQSERLTGFEIEFGQDLASELGLRADFVEATAAEVLPGVEKGTYDIALTPASESLKSDGSFDVSQAFGDKKLVIPFQKDNPAFETALNKALDRLKEKGRTEELENKWFKAMQAGEPTPAALVPAPAH
ncbi:transporter substrate-binding domain-containing protein [Pseudomonas vlassakiae]|jgi:ABC-type amino acid transport substrate-binding protein|uniref:substrate-binding periplasmic protein n=1 Tax=Pseudomonas TaxID=286 RepID=UPI0006D3ADD7|nr:MULTISPECIES: transporter substrate-binding domain-containing protein [Pseudomonas]AXQ46362.1 ABC transporter substrate-binding protein [Stenotrophomonas rhizophila]MBS3188024.1 transporter substrate-binding domain-containing protein [Pseudomonas sp. PCH44]MCU0122442.1 transporter substrate-binding domain-containing protein [Pseudomonas vlassakiae]PIK78628.1 ABC transporter substrate-binding protein [Pseudomonas sp. 382]HCV38304.1 ABC transporter substrate-binding protein [Pseudomonas sp.]